MFTNNMMKPSMKYTLQMEKKELSMYPEIKQLLAKLNYPSKKIIQKQFMQCYKCQNEFDIQFSIFKTDLVSLQFFKSIISFDTFNI